MEEPEHASCRRHKYPLNIEISICTLYVQISLPLPAFSFSCLIHFLTICFAQRPELPALINSQVSRLFTPPTLCAKSPSADQTPPSGDPSPLSFPLFHCHPSDRRIISQRTGQLKVRAYRKRRRSNKGMLYGRQSHLSRVLQDALTSHLGLSNSSVSVTDEPAPQMQQRRMADRMHSNQQGISHDRSCCAHPLHNV